MGGDNKMKTYLDLFQALRTVEEKLGVHGDVEILIRRAFGANIAVRVTVRTVEDSVYCEICAGENGSDTLLATLKLEEALRTLEDRLWRGK